jgi:hypothetical protein
MFRTPVTMMGLAGAVFLAGSFIPTSFNLASLAQSDSLFGRAVMEQAAATKGDRLASPLPADSEATVSIVELVGVGQATVILRDRHGAVLYQFDPRSGTTTFSKNTQLPIISLKEEPQAPAVQYPASRQEGSEIPKEQKQKPRSPVGCMGDVSPLARASAGRMPSLCLASLAQPLS